MPALLSTHFFHSIFSMFSDAVAAGLHGFYGGSLYDAQILLLSIRRIEESLDLGLGFLASPLPKGRGAGGAEAIG